MYVVECKHGKHLKMLFPELCDNLSLRWGPLHNAFILGTSLHIKKIKTHKHFLWYTLTRIFFGLTRTCCCQCCCHPQHCKSPVFCSALVCCCMGFLLVFLLARSVRKTDQHHRILRLPRKLTLETFTKISIEHTAS